MNRCEFCETKMDSYEHNSSLWESRHSHGELIPNWHFQQGEQSNAMSNHQSYLNSNENSLCTDSETSNRGNAQLNYQHLNIQSDQDYTPSTNDLETVDSNNSESEIPEPTSPANSKEDHEPQTQPECTSEKVPSSPSNEKEDHEPLTQSELTSEEVASPVRQPTNSNNHENSTSQEKLYERDKQHQEDCPIELEHGDDVLSINTSLVPETGTEKETTSSQPVSDALKVVNLEKIILQKPSTPPTSTPVVWLAIKEEPLDKSDAPEADISENSNNGVVDCNDMPSSSCIGSLQTKVDKLHTNVKLEPVSAPCPVVNTEESRPFNYGCQIKVERTDNERAVTKESQASNGGEQQSFPFSLESVKMLPPDELYCGDTDYFNHSDLNQTRKEAQPGRFIDPNEGSEIKNATIAYATGRSLQYYDKNIPHGWSRLKTQRKNGKVDRFDVYYFLNTPCGKRLKFRSKREIQEYLDNIGETMISGESFEFLASKVPNLPTPALQAFDTQERQAALQLFIQHFLTTPPILNFASNFPFANDKAARAKKVGLMPNCTLIEDCGTSRCHDPNVPYGWVKTIKKSTVSFTNTKDNLIFYNKLDIQGYLDAICDSSLTAECFDFGPTLSVAPLKKKKTAINPILVETLPMSQTSFEAETSSEALGNPTGVLLPPPSTYQPVSGFDPILKGLLNPSTHTKSKKENGNFVNRASKKQDDSGSKIIQMVPVDTSKNATISSIKGGISKEALTHQILKWRSSIERLDKSTPQSSSDKKQPSTSTRNGFTGVENESSSEKEPKQSADIKLGTIIGGYQKWYGSKGKEKQSVQQNFSFAKNTRENNFAPQMATPDMGPVFPMENVHKIRASDTDNLGIDTQTSGLKGRPRDNSDSEPFANKYRKIASANEKPQVFQVDDDDDDDDDIMEVPISAPPKKHDLRDRVTIAEFLSDNSNYNPGLSAFLSGNVRVQIYGGLDYIIHDETIPVGWQKCYKGVPNKPGIFTTWFVSPNGSNISSQLKLDKYLATNIEPGLPRRDFDFKSTPTFPRSAKILAREISTMSVPSKMPITWDLLGVPPKHKYSRSPPKEMLATGTVVKSSSTSRSTGQLPIASSSFTQSHENAPDTGHATGAPLLSAALGRENNLNPANILSKYLSFQQNNTNLQINCNTGQMQSNSDPEVINLDDDDDDDDEQSNLLSQIQNEISLKGNQVSNSLFSLRPCTFCGQVFANDFLLSNHVYAYHQNFA